MVNRENYKLIKAHLKYLEEVEQLSTSSLQRNWFWLRHLLLWAGETLLNRAAVIRPAFPGYVSALCGRQGEASLAASSQKKINAAARRFFLWAKSMGYKGYTKIPNSWIVTLRPSRFIPSSTEHVYVTFEEAILLATHPVDSQNLALRRDQAAAAMLYLSGARSSAFATLPIQAVNIPGRSINQWPELGVRTKNKKRGTTFLLPIPGLLDVVEEWDKLVRSKLPQDAPWYATIKNHWGEQKLTATIPGENRNQMLSKRLRKLFNSASLPYKSAHKFRHGHAVYGLQHARTMADYKAISLNLMHHDIEITDSWYAPILSDEVKKRIAGLPTMEIAEPQDELIAFLNNLPNTELSKIMLIVARRLAA
ncbi:MAG TPA: site-specific integrase [Anaerolineales bacterium]|nr:site-specific integrase [Anaerolineales bacterium]